MNPPFYKACLRAEFAHRCEANPRYSLRAFARALGTDAGTLSRVLSDKRPLTLKVGHRILGNLCLSPLERAHFVRSLAIDSQARRLRELGSDPEPLEEAPPTYDLENEVFRTIGDWYHAAILELTFVRGFQSDSRWIASRLGISSREARQAVERLLRLELLERAGGRLVKTRKQLATRDKSRTAAYLRRLQRQFLEKAIHSLEHDALEERSTTGMTMAIDPAKLPVATKLIQEFARELCRTLEKGRPERVYQLSVSLYPLQKAEAS